MTNKYYLKFSARRHALVLESSPPITTSPSKSSFKLVSSACLNCHMEEKLVICIKNVIRIKDSDKLQIRCTICRKHVVTYLK